MHIILNSYANVVKLENVCLNEFRDCAIINHNNLLLLISDEIDMHAGNTCYFFPNVMKHFKV